MAHGARLAFLGLECNREANLFAFVASFVASFVDVCLETTVAPQIDKGGDNDFDKGLLVQQVLDDLLQSLRHPGEPFVIQFVGRVGCLMVMDVAEWGGVGHH